jgi:hypothetical protein
MEPETAIEPTRLERKARSRPTPHPRYVTRFRGGVRAINSLAELLSILHGISDEMPGINDKDLQRTLQTMVDRASTVIFRTVRRAAFADGAARSSQRIRL